MKQNQVAEVLGITQSSVSKYTRKVRGRAIEISSVEGLQPLISKMTALLINEPHARTEFLEYFCQTCRTIRKTSLMCQFCEKADPRIKSEECIFCLSCDSLST